MSGLSKLEKLTLAAASAVPCAEFLFYKNTVPHTAAERALGTPPPIFHSQSITPYLGDFPETFIGTAASGLFGDYLRDTAKNPDCLQAKIGTYFPEIAAIGLSAYFTLGETVLPQILPGTPDWKDVPAVIISAMAGYVVAKLSRKAVGGSFF